MVSHKISAEDVERALSDIMRIEHILASSSGYRGVKFLRYNPSSKTYFVEAICRDGSRTESSCKTVGEAATLYSEA